ncbi:FKBP-type peptidyl-prolyl cis-trans isomerase [Flavobacterium sp.]|uniref:FKBP-type peptidyl-prolyl cis-trans isomerase n=1 Tax=Flavobacterium sp. TaxID=239 RepID=UPI0022C2C801|nr:FKBP-type peptidyl-prolyl cis-trans isomerase [Flavobacterium sp.]MCZ8228399.1 FKBP-type peptidyl-prolyl cis-trans isomerase [Flavobacterium sp.]
MKKLTSAFMLLTLFVSCSLDKNEVVDYTAQNEQEIKDYLTKNNLSAKRTNSGLYYIINEEGTGEHPTATSNVTVIYKGYFTNGTVFDQSKPEGFTVGLNQVIKGWTEGIPYFKKGGSGVLLVPAHLGYGSFDYGPIPGGSVLLFDIKLVSIN